MKTITLIFFGAVIVLCILILRENTREPLPVEEPAEPIAAPSARPMASPTPPPFQYPSGTKLVVVRGGAVRFNDCVLRQARLGEQIEVYSHNPETHRIYFLETTPIGTVVGRNIDESNVGKLDGDAESARLVVAPRPGVDVSDLTIVQGRVMDVIPGGLVVECMDSAETNRTVAEDATSVPTATRAVWDRLRELRNGRFEWATVTPRMAATGRLFLTGWPGPLAVGAWVRVVAAQTGGEMEYRGRLKMYSVDFKVNSGSWRWDPNQRSKLSGSNGRLRPNGPSGR